MEDKTCAGKRGDHRAQLGGQVGGGRAPDAWRSHTPKGATHTPKGAHARVEAGGRRRVLRHIHRADRPFAQVLA